VATVLILAREEVVAALLGLLVELRGYQPVYPKTGESAGDACVRLRCEKLIIDCDHWGSNERSLKALEQSGVRVILFSPSRVPSDIRRGSGQRGIQTFTLPIGPEAFGRLLG
jgi:hypothetical protein